jgi:hypothetical protein
LKQTGTIISIRAGLPIEQLKVYPINFEGSLGSTIGMAGVDHIVNFKGALQTTLPASMIRVPVRNNKPM